MSENTITFGSSIREGRDRLGWTQAQLAEKIGVTPSFITKLERDEALPSYDRILALANVLVLDANMLIPLVEQNKEDRGRQRIKTRGASMRTSYGLGGEGQFPEGRGPGSALNTAAQIGREILENPDLQTAFTHLRIGLKDPKLGPAILKTLEAFAKQANSKD